VITKLQMTRASAALWPIFTMSNGCMLVAHHLREHTCSVRSANAENWGLLAANIAPPRVRNRGMPEFACRCLGKFHKLPSGHGQRWTGCHSSHRHHTSNTEQAWHPAQHQCHCHHSHGCADTVGCSPFGVQTHMLLELAGTNWLCHPSSI